jgi:hypothetical protein
LNGRVFFRKQKMKLAAEKAAMDAREAKRQRTERAKVVKNQMFPTHSLVIAGSESNEGGADVRGSVVLPGTFAPVNVDGYVLQWRICSCCFSYHVRTKESLPVISLSHEPPTQSNCGASRQGLEEKVGTEILDTPGIRLSSGEKGIPIPALYHERPIFTIGCK